jgi:ParB family chromosome partitioning protein
MSDIYRDSIFWVEVERIEPNPFQPRREFDQAKLNELAESIRMYGLLQPLTVTRKEDTRQDGNIQVAYELIAGERRLRASKIAGLQQVPVIIRDGQDSDQMKLELAIIENLQREDLNPVDRAKAFSRLYKDFHFTHAQIGKKVGKSREYVSNTLRLLTLPESIQGYLAEGRMSEGHTRPLLMLNDRPEEQAVLIKEILLKKLTVRESEALARRAAQDKVSARYKVDPEILALEKTLTEKLGTRVQIEPRESGGKVVISFFSADDLQTLLNSMRVVQEEGRVSEVFNGDPRAPRTDLTPIPGEGKAPDERQVPEIPVASEATSSAPTESAVAPAPERPQPEVAPQASPVDVQVPVAAAVTQEKEDDSDLYSIRNFSI